MQEIKKFFTSEENIQNPKVIILGDQVDKILEREKLLPKYYTKSLEQYFTPIKIQDKIVNLNIYFEDFKASNETLRKAVFSNMSVFILVVSLLDQNMQATAIDKFYPEIAKYGKPIMLIGIDKERVTKLDASKCSVQLRGVALSCDAVYYCEYSAGENIYSIYEIAGNLATSKKSTVAKSAQSPTLITLENYVTPIEHQKQLPPTSPRSINKGGFFSTTPPKDPGLLSVSPPRDFKHVAHSNPENAQAAIFGVLTSPKSPISESMNIQQDDKPISNPQSVQSRGLSPRVTEKLAELSLKPPEEHSSSLSPKGRKK